MLYGFILVCSVALARSDCDMRNASEVIEIGSGTTPPGYLMKSGETMAERIGKGEIVFPPDTYPKIVCIPVKTKGA